MKTTPLKTINVPDDLSDQHVECTICGTTADYAEQLKGHVHATTVTDEELVDEQLYHLLVDLLSSANAYYFNNHTTILQSGDLGKWFIPEYIEKIRNIMEGKNDEN